MMMVRDFCCKDFFYLIIEPISLERFVLSQGPLGNNAVQTLKITREFRKVDTGFSHYGYTLRSNQKLDVKKCCTLQDGW